MAEQLIIDRRVLDANGDPLSGAKLYAYLEGTTTLENIYSDDTLGTAHPSPLVSDAGGNFPPIWHAGDHGVKIRIDDASDVEISWSPLDPCPMTSSATSAENISYTPTANNPANDVQEAIENASSLGRTVSNKSTDYTALSSDRATVIRCTSALTLSLSTASVLGDGWFAVVKADGGTVTIDPDGSETIDGETTKAIADGLSVEIYCDGTSFYTSGSSSNVIARAVASDVATIEFTGFDSSKYDAYDLYFSKVLPATDGAILGIRTSTDGGSTYDSGGSDYFYAATSRTGGGDTGYASTASFGQLTFAVGNVGAQETGVSGRLSIHGPHLSNRCDITFETASVLNTGSASIACGMITRDTVADVDAIQLSFSTGNITSGTFTLYGRRNA